MNNQEYCYIDKRERRITYVLQLIVVLGILSYDTIISMNPLIYYGARVLFLISIIIVFCRAHNWTSLNHNVIFLMFSLLFLYHIVQSFALDLLIIDNSYFNLLGFLKVMLPRFLFFLIICLIIGSISRPSFWTILKPIVYLGTLFSLQGIIGAFIIYFDIPVSRNYVLSSYYPMLEIGPNAIFGYGNSIYGYTFPILRAQSIFAECSVFARFLGVSMWVTFFIYLTYGRKKYLFFLLIQSMCFMLTYALSSFIGMFFSLLIGWLMFGKKSLILMKSISAMLVMAGMLYVFFILIPEYVSDHEIKEGIGVVMSRYTVKNFGTERHMADLPGIYEFLMNDSWGKGFSTYTASSADSLGIGNFINTWIRLGGPFSILIWILIFSYFGIWYINNIWRQNIKDPFIQCIFISVVFFSVASAGTGSLLDTYFLFFLAIIGTLFAKRKGLLLTANAPKMQCVINVK